jgi:hypothetical protein
MGNEYRLKSGFLYVKSLGVTLVSLVPLVISMMSLCALIERKVREQEDKEDAFRDEKALDAFHCCTNSLQQLISYHPCTLLITLS